MLRRILVTTAYMGTTTRHWRLRWNILGILGRFEPRITISNANTRSSRNPKTPRAFLSRDKKDLDPVDINWEGVVLKCHSQYEILGLVLSILGRAPPEATRRNHHLPLLILCVRFVILAAGEQPKIDAPTSVSIMFTDDDGECMVQVACSSPDPPGLGDIDNGTGFDAVTECSDLNVVIGTTVLLGKTDFLNNSIRDLRRLIRLVRYDFLEKAGGYRLPGTEVSCDKVCILSPRIFLFRFAFHVATQVLGARALSRVFILCSCSHSCSKEAMLTPES